MKTIDLHSLANVTGGAGALPTQHPTSAGALSPQQLQNMLLDPIGQVGPMMKAHPGLPVSQSTINAVIRPTF